MSLIDTILQPVVKRSATKILTDLNSLQKANLQKADSSGLVMPATRPGVLRYTFDPVYVNSNYYSKKKPDSAITFDVLRNFSLKYEVVRACINLRKRQIAGMEWDIVTAETADSNDYSKDILKAKEFIAKLGRDPRSQRGGGSRIWMNQVIEDLLAIDAVALYRVRSNKDDLLTLMPIDGATIRLMTTGVGSPPPPPQIAYKQVIRGRVTAELTTDDLIYTVMNPRTNSPYGLAPLETLLVTVSSALKAALYNLGFLSDSNVPPGIIEAPEKWNSTMIQEFMANWNAAVAGEDAALNRLHMVPHGANYQPIRKPSDMAFGDFNMWLMRLTCAMFDVAPLEIGFEPEHGLGGASFSRTQREVSNDKGLRPIANIIEELLTDVIQLDMGMTHLKFSFTGLDAEYIKENAEVNQILITTGQRTINELRTNDGLSPIEGGDALFFAGGKITPLNEEAVNIVSMTVENGSQETSDEPNEGGEEDAGSVTAETRSEAAGKKKKQPKKDSGTDSAADDDVENADTPDFKKLSQELRMLRKFYKSRFESGRKINRPFVSAVLPPLLVDDLNARLARAKFLGEVDEIIKQYDLAIT